MALYVEEIRALQVRISLRLSGVDGTRVDGGPNCGFGDVIFITFQDASTINTREPQRDAHLKSADFFHVESHPDLTFNSTSISKDADGELKVSGDLTIRGVTRNVVFDVEGPSPAQKDPWGNTRIGLSATTRISRKDFGLTWNAALEAGGLLVGDAVTINLDVQLIKER